MTLSVWLAYAVFATLLAVIPGPGVATIVGFAFTSGRRTALAAVAGMAIGNLIAVTLSLAGAGALLAASALAFLIVKWMGAAYLIVLGVLALARAGSRDPEAPNRRAIAPRTAFFSTIAVGTFHPKTIIFFVAFATQFVDPDAAYLPQALVLGGTFVGIAALTDSIYAVTASKASQWVAHGRVRRWAQRLGGGVLIGAGVATAALRR